MAGDERYDLWRKQGFICRPHTGEISDGTRFTLEYMEQVQKYAADDDEHMSQLTCEADGE